MSGKRRCRNCGCELSQRRPFARKDCCRECFKVSEYLKVVEKWNGARPEIFEQHFSIEGFAEYKSRLICELNTELKYLHSREATRRDASLTDGLTIEKKLGSILDLLRGKVRNRNVFHGIATSIDHCFDQEQRRILFELLDDIEDQVYWPIHHAQKEVWPRAFREGGLGQLVSGYRPPR
jgi:hypothetical protein